MGIREIRKLGKEFCETEGSQHYKDGGVEPIDLIISKGLGKDFCIANIIKYATRFKNTGNLEDVKKAVDYGHILAGIELDKLQTARGKVDSAIRGCRSCKYWHMAQEASGGCLHCGSSNNFEKWEPKT